MEEIDKTLFSEGGTAQGAYLPYQPLPMLLPSDSVRDCAQHTSDLGDDQHPLRIGQAPSSFYWVDFI